VNKKFVNAGYLTAVVPFMRKGPFEVAEGMTAVSPNDVNDLTKFKSCKDFVIIGGGKTSMDCIIHLFESGVEPSCVRWIVPNDPMIVDRDDVFFGEENRYFMNHFPLIKLPTNYLLADEFSAFLLFLTLLIFWVISNYTMILGFSVLIVGLFVIYSALTRYSPEIKSTAYKCCTLGRDEYEKLSPALTNIVRYGRVSSISDSEIIMVKGKISVNTNSVIIDCSSNGLTARAAIPVWEGDKITL
jgi:hypothetical protein